MRAQTIVTAIIPQRDEPNKVLVQHRHRTNTFGFLADKDIPVKVGNIIEFPDFFAPVKTIYNVSTEQEIVVNA